MTLPHAAAAGCCLLPFIYLLLPPPGQTISLHLPPPSSATSLPSPSLDLLSPPGILDFKPFQINLPAVRPLPNHPNPRRLMGHGSGLEW